eukprot:Sspe_Gene.88268::Locus_60326_Transcript_4_5_Confidence_0.455_Length_390::g.88268::m.88268
MPLSLASGTRQVNGTVVFAKVDLTVSPGEVLIVQGESGCGKSTLLRCLSQLDELDKGKLTLDGKTAAEYGYPMWRRDVAYVPQGRSSGGFSDTPWDLAHQVSRLASNRL